MYQYVDILFRKEYKIMDRFKKTPKKSIKLTQNIRMGQLIINIFSLEKEKD